MQERLIYLGKMKHKEIGENFDDVMKMYENIAIEKGYREPKIKLFREKKVIKFYVIIDF